MDFLLSLFKAHSPPIGELLKRHLEDQGYDDFISLAKEDEEEALEICEEYGRCSPCRNKEQMALNKDLIRAFMKTPIWLYAVAVSAYKYDNQDLLLLMLDNPDIENAFFLLSDCFPSKCKVGAFITYLCRHDMDMYATLFNHFVR